MSVRDTIFALSSGRPPAAIAVIRISGPRAGEALKSLSGKIPEPRKAALARIRNADNEIIDEALALWFPGPNSETGEDTAELQLHGGRAVIASVLGALGKIDGLRPAEAGEFTRRAFENGKLDLTAVEGLADLVMAETEGQRRQAFRQMKGLLGNRAEDWRARLIKALALVEARIDFSDEADVPQDLLKPALAVVRALAGEIGEALADTGRGERLRDGLVVAIAGPPNAGKSTLLNRLAQREAAIVSPTPGTTRDVIEVHLDLGGYPVTLLDTAGIRETDDAVELEGVRRAQARAAAADLVLWVTDVSAEIGSGETTAERGVMPESADVAEPIFQGRTAGWAPQSNPRAMDWAPAAATPPNPYFSNPVSASGPTSKQPDGASPADPPANTQTARSARPPEGSSAAGPNPDFSNPDSAFGLKQSAGASAEQSKALAAASALISLPKQAVWIIRNKADLVDYRSEARKLSYGRSEPRRPAKIDKVNKGLPERS
ncbi:MAG TPA: tRNA uridine-5-carboxymethylaminomethyl(34) synthesis GTPase MnmE, partial [Stellaceae bacterium]|nr:tRNA uridine-5-carboxymethylaminomethyl(34) synthesis GTPase MnmE [Stellaceae bacterium]